MEIVYVSWASELASSNVVKAVIVENLDPNLEGTRIGLVVPEYADIDSIG